ncbi:hypothetical protein GCM10020216_106400 [Nonomuraea helvata]
MDEIAVVCVGQGPSAEADSLCGAGYGQRSSERTNRRNGYRTREWDARAGSIELAIPKLREGSYFPDWLLERRRRAEQALISVIATSYLHDPPADRPFRPRLAQHVSTPDPGAWLLDRIDATRSWTREKALTGHIEQLQAQIEELTARLRDLDQDLDHLRITRKPLVIAGEPGPASPPPPAPAAPDHPAYQQILTLMAHTGQPSLARDLCLAPGFASGA